MREMTPRGGEGRSVPTASPVKEDRLDQRDHVPAGVVTGTNARYVDELQRHKSRGHRGVITVFLHFCFSASGTKTGVPIGICSSQTRRSLSLRSETKVLS